MENKTANNAKPTLDVHISKIHVRHWMEAGSDLKITNGHFHPSSSLDTVEKGTFLNRLVTLYIHRILETVFCNGSTFCGIPSPFVVFLEILMSYIVFVPGIKKCESWCTRKIGLPLRPAPQEN